MKIKINLINFMLIILFSIVSFNLKAQEEALYLFVQDGNEYSGELKFGFKNSKGEIIVPFIYDYIPRSVDLGNRIEFFSNPRYIFLGEFNEGMAVVFKKNKGYGFINNRGKEVIPCQYESALAFTEGLAAVKNKEGKWGYIDMEGNTVIPHIYEWPQQFCEGVAFVNEGDDKFYYINKNGDKLNKKPSSFGNHWATFADGRGSVNIDGKIGYIDEKGNEVIPLIYDSGTKFFPNGLAGVTQNDKSYWINKDGEIIYENLGISGWFYECNGIYYGTTANKLIRDDGKVILSDAKKIFFNKDSETVIVQNNKDKYGVYDLEGRIIIPFIYDDFSGYGEGLYLFQKDGYLGFVNKRNEVCIPFEFEDSDPFKYNMGLTFAKKRGYWNIINTKGEEQTVWCDEDKIVEKVDEAIKNSINTEIDLNIPFAPSNNNNTFAIIWGNEKYMESIVDDALYAIHDAEIISKYIEETLGVPQKNIRYKNNVTLSQMQNDIDWLNKIIENFGNETSIIIYYSGHGLPDPYSGNSYIIPSDGNPSNSNTLFNLNKLYDTISENDIKKCTIFLDACFSGKSRSGESLISNRAISIKNKPLNHSNLYVLSASEANEVAYPFYGKGHGMFTYYLLKILNETNGKANLSEISDYVIENTRKSALLENNTSQTPTVFIGASINSLESLKE